LQDVVQPAATAELSACARKALLLVVLIAAFHGGGRREYALRRIESNAYIDVATFSRLDSRRNVGPRFDAASTHRPERQVPDLPDKKNFSASYRHFLRGLKILTVVW
jgi:hypothetical protein